MKTAVMPDLSSLSAFLATVEQRAYRSARAALWDHDAALDVVQDSMLKLAQHYAARPAPEWTALFFTILNRRINDVRRSRKVRRMASRLLPWLKPEDEPEAAPVPVWRSGSDDPAPETALDRQQSATRLEHALQQLPERQRQVIILRELHELSINETAETLGCTIGTVKQHHHRALQALRAIMAGE